MDGADETTNKAAGDSCPTEAASPAHVAPVAAPTSEAESVILIKKVTDVKEPTEDANSNENSTESSNNNQTEISKLEQEIQKRTYERDNYQQKLMDTEKKLDALQASYNAVANGEGDEIKLRREKEDLKNMLTQTQLKLEERNRMVANQENQINALTKQTSSLKEVVAITKQLLNIRNMEVKHLQNDVDTMEAKITAERDRHNDMINKMDAAVRLNADLKKEYETQLRLFQDLRGKYEEKVTLLTEENRALENAKQPMA
ncbi:uncharacterized protein LOC107270207 [Cephus cinctus]|uniref:Uncharacterized protein LOC107270207 n=1 Tax=Cephus cinctus TaxID=211228 RepID=A0AAJ7C2U5_CEPCN|nr:uncharacterized protein LOC107270207 [Cephus cinctus]XP_015600496.1 uncharacterized protein LOC107270207 [Cephus cinctus]XP_015600497.1 uncharacterized protein LOC107270207 [Cephus cinctus]